MNNWILKYRFQLLLFAVILIGYLPIVGFVKSLKYDMIDISLPWRFFIGECFQNGELPLWNPFINFGFPQISEPQTWYPIAIIFQLIGRYTLFSLHIEFVLHLLVAGSGMFYFLKAKSKDQATALALAVLYVFSGFFVGNAQHFGWVISAAWLPWIWFHFLKVLESKQTNSILMLPVVLYFMLTGGYPAFFVTNLYIMLGYFLVWALRNQGLKKPRVILGLVAAAGILALLSFGAISSFYEIKYLITRGSTLSWEALGIGSLSLKSLISTVAPLLVTTKAEMWGVLDYGLTNLFLGFGFMGILLLGIWRFNWNFGWKLLVGLFFLWMALGPEFLLLKVLASVIPFLDVFRFPALYRLFTIFFWIWAAAEIIQGIDLKRFNNLRTWIPIIFLSMAMVSFLWMHKASFMDGFPLPEGYKVWTISQRAFIWFLGLAIISGIAWMVTKKAAPKQFLLALIIAEGLWHVVIYGPVSIYYWETTQTAEKYLTEIPKGFPAQNIDEPTVQFLEKDFTQTSFLWRNRAHYPKQLAADGYSPYVFFDFYKLSNSDNWNKVLEKPFAFLESGSQRLNLTSFTPSKFVFEIDVEAADQFVLKQNFLNGWQAKVNNQIVEIKPYLGAFMQIQIPSGKNEIEFCYLPNFSKVRFFFPFVLSLVALLVAAFLKARSKP